MFIGKIGGSNNNPLEIMVNSINRVHSRQPLNVVRKNVDTVKLSGKEDTLEKDAGIYTRPQVQMKQLFPDGFNYTVSEPDLRLQECIRPSSEKAYTEEDALMNQYMKQYRINGHVENGTFAAEGTVRLILPDSVSSEELESFRQTLAQDGLGDEIDWRGVSDDFIQMGVTSDNAGYLEEKVDYIASRYAVLKDRIGNQYTGSEKDNQMDTLNNIYSSAKEEMVNAYADSVGSFYESLGQAGIGSEMKNSILDAINQRTSEYENYLADADDYAHIKNQEDQWLLQDDGFMAAQLRESMAASEQGTEKEAESGTYSMKDLELAGTYAKTLNSRLDQALEQWFRGDERSIGKNLAEQWNATKEDLGKSGASDKLSKLLSDTYEPFMNRLMDQYDQRIGKQKEAVAKEPWLAGTIRTSYLDRDAVYQAFYDAAGK